MRIYMPATPAVKKLCNIFAVGALTAARKNKEIKYVINQKSKSMQVTFTDKKLQCLCK